MEKAVQEAFLGLRKGHGGPFGAVIVRNNRLIARAHNQVLSLKDPTAHAEVQAIRLACRKLGRFDLSDCEIYSTCEPCPMCFAAIHWAKMKRLYYGCTRQDAEKIGFSDKFIYDVIQGRSKKHQVTLIPFSRKACLEPFKKWLNTLDKQQY